MGDLIQTIQSIGKHRDDFYFHLVSIESISKPLENLLYEYFEEITLINEKTRLVLENFTSFENINQ